MEEDSQRKISYVLWSTKGVRFFLVRLLHPPSRNLWWLLTGLQFIQNQGRGFIGWESASCCCQLHESNWMVVQETNEWAKQQEEKQRRKLRTDLRKWWTQVWIWAGTRQMLPAAFLFKVSIFLSLPLSLGDQLKSTLTILSCEGSVQCRASTRTLRGFAKWTLVKMKLGVLARVQLQRSATWTQLIQTVESGFFRQFIRQLPPNIVIHC